MRRFNDYIIIIKGRKGEKSSFYGYLPIITSIQKYIQILALYWREIMINKETVRVYFTGLKLLKEFCDYF